MRYRLAAAAASLSLLIGCIAHEKEGDSSAAMGDWKSAYVHYRNALAEKPETPGLKPKFDNARVQALQQSRQQANSCMQQRDWVCAGAESQFILDAEPGAPDATQMKATASLYQAMDILQQARAAAAQRQFQQAADSVRRAREMSNAPEVQAEAQRVQMEIAAAAVAESDRLRQERKYDEAVQAMKIATQYDPSQANRLRAVEQEREQWIAFQYDKATYDGDVAMSQRDWRTASEAYRAAMAFRPGGRAEAQLRYCDAMLRADAALQARQFEAAATAYQEAVATGVDKGEARAALDRLRIRPYVVSVRSVLLVPTRADGNPWTGPVTPQYFRIAQFVQQHLQSHNMDRAVEMAMTVPNENQPELRVEVVMPNGTVLATKPVKGLYAAFDGEVVIASNGYDDRHLFFRVMQKSAAPEGEELGRIDFAMRDLCEQGDITMNGQSIGHFRVTAKAADGRQEGAFGMVQVQQAPTAVAQTPPPAGPANTPPPPPGQPTGGGTGGTVVVTGGTAAPPPANAGGTVTYVPPPKASTPSTPPAAPPPPKPPPVAPPMATTPPAASPPAVGAPPPAAPPPAAGGAPSGDGDDDKDHGKGKGKGKKKHPRKGGGQDD